MDFTTRKKRLKDLSAIDVRMNIEHFMKGEGRDKGRHPDERYASFDYCFNYFQIFRERKRIEDICHTKHIQESCLQLGFYLASWGMLRGSSFLLNKSARYYMKTLETICRLDKRIWEVDMNSYTDEGIDLLLDAKESIFKAMEKECRPSDTLITKIMLGVFGNIPAFDSFFRRGFDVGAVNRKHLLRISDFYRNHHRHLDRINIYTLDFQTGKETKRKYTQAKALDMVGFMEGLK